MFNEHLLLFTLQVALQQALSSSSAIALADATNDSSSPRFPGVGYGPMIQIFFLLPWVFSSEDLIPRVQHSS